MRCEKSSFYFRWLGSARGGVALEYILVTTFASVVGLAALKYVANLTRDHLEQVGKELGHGQGQVDFGIFDR